MKIHYRFALICLLAFAVQSNNSYSQTLVEDFGSNMSLGDTEQMFTETIRIISRSQKIFILTNTNQMLYKGDFITIILNEKDAVARALVGKTYDGLAGIKILKIYSLKNWAKMRQDLDVQILKGDDSKLFNNVKTEIKEDKSKSIENEEDLYREIVDDDFDSFQKDARHIKPDNVVSIGVAQYSFENSLNNDDTLTENQLNATWAYQFADNIWAEGLFGVTRFNDFPTKATVTLVQNYTVRFKYTFKAPFYSYVLPYIGYQIYVAQSPDAGKDPLTADEEEKILNDIQKRQFIAGATILKRLVPGWFLRADIGNDIMAVGFAIEF